jgi:uncharacterized membrane protein
MSEETKSGPLANPDNRRKIYAVTLLVCVLGLAAVGLSKVWGINFSDSFLFKICLTFVIGSALSIFLYTLTYRHGDKKIQRLGFFTGVCAATLSGVILLQIWFQAFNEAFFGKLSITLVVLGLIAAFIIAVFDDFFENKKMKEENYLD